MARLHTRFAAFAAVLGTASFCSFSSAAVNGALEPGEYGPALATQNIGTGFGNNFSELNAAYGSYNTGTGNLSLLLTGNLEGNGNGVVLFFDTRPGGAIASTLPGGFGVLGSMGGQRVDDWGTDLDGGAGVNPTPGGGSVLSPGFNPDFALEINAGGGGANYFINVIDMTIPNDVNPDKDIFLGGNATGGGAVTQTYIRSGGPQGTVTHAFDNSNTAGVNGLGDPPGDPLSALTGFEFELSSAFLALGNSDIKIFAFVTNGGGDFLANQFMPGNGATGNLGGPGGLGGIPLFDVREFPNSSSFFTVVVPEPGSLALAGILGISLLTRRRFAR